MVVALEGNRVLVFTTVSPVKKRILKVQLNGRPKLSDAEAQIALAQGAAASRTCPCSKIDAAMESVCR